MCLIKIRKVNFIGPEIVEQSQLSWAGCLTVIGPFLLCI